jgi:spermidine/putrescine transport system substrate-binding protein
MTDPRLNDPITRRLFLRRAAIGAGALSLPSLIAACGGGGGISAQSNAGGASTEVKQQLADTLVFANWPLYIDQKGKKRPSLDEFTAQSGVNVRYIEEVNDNEEWFGKYQAQLSQGQDIGRDLTVLTDWMAARMVRLGYVQKKDKSAIPNEANLVSTLQHPTWDQDRAYSMPWQSGMTGIAYNKKETGPVTSIEQLLTDSALKGKVTCLTEMPDCMGLIMQSNGDDPTTVDPAAFDKAIGTLQDAVDSGQIRRFTGNSSSTTRTSSSCSRRAAA